MSDNALRAKLPPRLAVIAATALIVGGLSAMQTATADAKNFGQGVYNCAGMMLPYSIDSHGSITMTMPDGTIMHWRSFGAMVTYMRNQPMCQ